MTRQHPHSAQESAPSAQKEVVSMSDPQSLEEAWRNHGLALTSEELDDAARALALAAHTAVCLRCSSPGWDCADRRRIEALGK